MDPIPYREHFDHEADIGLHGIDNTLDEAFEQAAPALTAVEVEGYRKALLKRQVLPAALRVCSR